MKKKTKNKKQPKNQIYADNSTMQSVGHTAYYEDLDIFLKVTYDDQKYYRQDHKTLITVHGLEATPLM